MSDYIYRDTRAYCDNGIVEVTPGIVVVIVGTVPEDKNIPVSFTIVGREDEGVYYNHNRWAFVDNTPENLKALAQLERATAIARDANALVLDLINDLTFTHPESV